MVFVLLIYFCIIFLKLNQTLFKKGLKISGHFDALAACNVNAQFKEGVCCMLGV